MENQLLKKSGTIAAIVTFALLGAWFGFSKLSLGIDTSNWTPYAMKKNSVVSEQLIIMCGTSGSGIVFGTTSGAWVGTPTDSTLARVFFNTATGRLEFKPSGTTTSFPFGSVTVAYLDTNYATIGSVSAKLDAVGGVGTGNTFNNVTVAGQGTTTATTNYNGANISPTEVSYLDGMSENISGKFTTVTGSITNHVHSGSDGTAQISHNNVTGSGTTSHADLDTFKNSKAQASGLASLDASSLVVQNPASASKTPGTSTIVMTGSNTDRIADAYLSDNITKLGTPTTDNISEGSTNKYYTNARVNAAVGSLSVNTLSDVNIIFNENDFVKIVGGQLVAGSSSTSVAFSSLTGVPTDSGTFSATSAANKIPVGSTSGNLDYSWIPGVIRLTGTTTAQPAATFGQLYLQTDSVDGGAFNGFGTLTTTSLVSYYRLENLNDSFGANTLTNFGTTTFVAGKSGSCTTFNGTDQYLRTSLLSTQTTNISIFAWVYIPTTSEARPFFNNGVEDADTNGYGLVVGGNNGVTSGNKLIGHLHTISWMDFSLTIGTGWHHVGMTRGTNTWTGYVDKVAGTATFTANPTAPTGNFTIGRNVGGTNPYYNDKIDDVVFYNKELSAGEVIDLYNNTWLDKYTQYSAKYKDPVNGQTVFSIETAGTATTAKSSYIYCNATTTVFGLGTNTAITGTISGAYAGWTNRPIRVTAVDIGSTEKIKENIKPIKIKPDLLDAEGIAKQAYITGSKSVWMAANQQNYTTIINETGTGSMTVVDNTTMESDYNNQIELQWASDMNKNVYIENVQKTYEKDFWKTHDSITPKSWNPIGNPAMTREGFIVEDMPDILKGEDEQSVDLGALVAYMAVVGKALKADTIFALSTVKELLTTGTVTQQKIDYCNNRLEVLIP